MLVIGSKEERTEVKMSKSKFGLMDQLPTEILSLIFSKLPVKILARIKCVCKLWSKIIDDGIPYEPGSIKEHVFVVLAKSRHRKPTVIWKDDGATTFLKISSSVFSMVAGSQGRYYFENSCRGLLCFARQRKTRLACLLNPMTQQIIKLPPAAHSNIKLEGSWCFSKYGLGFDSVTRTYKVVRVFHLVSRSNENSQFELFHMNTQIYTLGFGFGKKSSSWRSIKCVPPCPLAATSRAIYVGGFLHWFMSVERQQIISEIVAFNKHKIVAFHLSKEEFCLISLPRSLFRPGHILSCHLVDLRGVLGLVHLCRRYMDVDIWTMKDYDKEEWVKTCSLRLPSFFHISGSPFIGPWENGKLVLNYGRSLISFDPNNNKWSCIYTQLEDNNKVFFRKKTSSTCVCYDIGAEKLTETKIPPTFYDDYTEIYFYTESLLLLSPFRKS